MGGSPKPTETLWAVLGQYGDQFTLEGGKAFALTAALVGDAKLGEIGDGPCNVLDRRKREIEDAQNQKRNIGILGALFGMPMVTAVSLVQMVNDDSRIQTLNASIARAREQRGDLNARASEYRLHKARLSPRLDRLKTNAARLSSTLDGCEPKLPSNMAEVACAAVKLERRQKLLSNLREQVQILEEIRGEAKDLEGFLRSTLNNLRSEVIRAENLVMESKDELFSLIDIVGSNDPNAAATAWLDDQVAKRTSEVVGKLGIDPHEYVSHLLTRALPGDSAVSEAQTEAQARRVDDRTRHRHSVLP